MVVLSDGPVAMVMLSDDPVAIEDAADILKAIAHPVRLGIVALLVEVGAMHVGALAERLGVKQPIASQQLRILRMRGLVDVDRTAGQATYSLAEPNLKTLVRCMRKCCSLGKGG